MELHPSGFVETGVCAGPRYIREQPSRETPGVLLNDVTDKYVTEFNLMYRNAFRSLKELESNWKRLSSEQKKDILDIIGPHLLQKSGNMRNLGPNNNLAPQATLTYEEQNIYIPIIVVLSVLLIFSLCYIGYVRR